MVFFHVSVTTDSGGGRRGFCAQGAPDPTAAVLVQVEASMLPGINGGFVTYRVDTSTTLPGFARPEASVRRRFREFVARLPCPSL